MMVPKRFDMDYTSMLYKCNCAHGCTNMMSQQWFLSYFGICKECVYASVEHIEAMEHNRSSYESHV